MNRGANVGCGPTLRGRGLYQPLKEHIPAGWRITRHNSPEERINLTLVDHIETRFSIV